VSSIRIFILGALDARGEMHGHQLRLLAEEEHIDQWTDITVGALYGAIKRLATEGLIEERRVEREGSFPERQVWGITAEGREALGVLRHRGLREIVHKPDPFDMAMTRLDPNKLDDVEAGRRAGCRTVLLDDGGETVWRRSPLRIPHARCVDWPSVSRLILADRSGLRAAVMPPAVTS